MTTDPSLGWDSVADRFMAVRSDIGTALVRSWALQNVPPSTDILDLGCGSGVPIAQALVRDGFTVWGIDASPTLVAAYRRHLPDMRVACEAVQDSRFFDRRFAGIVAIGLMFLLQADAQRSLLARVAGALEPGGHFLFSAPGEVCAWHDTLTGRLSRSLGTDAYATILADVGLTLVDCHIDEGGNRYHDVIKPG